MIEGGALGEKSGRGFYQRRKTASGESEILTLDLDTLAYRAKQSARIASLEAAKSTDDVRERVRMLFNAKDKAGQFLRETLAPTLVYTARVAPDIAHTIDDVDRVMKWGFAWDLGPIRAVRCDRRARSAGRGASGRRPRRGCGHSTADSAGAGCRPQRVPRRTRSARRGRPADPSHRTRRRSGSSARTPARASSISATACSASSSTRR